MWVADMDFRTAPCVIDALRQRVDHGIFGYVKVPTSYYKALTGWFVRRHGWEFNPREVIYTSGVVPALSAIIKGLTRPGEKVIVQTPAYNCFFSSIRNNGCLLAANRLIYNTDGRYSIDFENLEQLASDPDTRLMLLCNPHNPASRIWSADELRKIADICSRHGVTVVADEIHCELNLSQIPFTPFATVAGDAKWVACNSPSKAFNTAGLQIANIVCPDTEMRAAIDRAINDNEVCDVNPFGVVGLIAAYNEGGEWLDSLLEYLKGNYLAARTYLEAELPQVKLTPLEATYLLWANISATGMDSEAVAELLEREGKVMVSPGSIYGPGGEQFIRLNLACPRSRLMEGLQRIALTLKPLLK